MATYLAWRTPPSLSALQRATAAHTKPLYLIICLPDNKIPEFAFTEEETTAYTSQKLPSASAAEWQSRLQKATQCLQFNGMNVVEHLLPDVHLWIAPPVCADRLPDYFGNAPLIWQTEALPQTASPAPKPWFMPSANHTPPDSVLVIGAGIAGASTARLLAEQGIPVTVLERGRIAQGGSGNRQGLLYAKISPNPTEQTELLLAGYGYTRRLLETLLPEADCWGGSGVVHLDYNEAERKRHQALTLHTHHRHLYRRVTSSEIQTISGLDFFADGMYWPQGVWLNPPGLIRALLDHPLITVREHSPLCRSEYRQNRWFAHTPQDTFEGSHIVYCMGAHSPYAAETDVAALPYRQIRGQTGLARAGTLSAQLKCAVSGESYISPAWQNLHCYGATFGINNNDERWQETDEMENRRMLHRLHPLLAYDLLAEYTDGMNMHLPASGHAALRCDSPDHLPMVGAVGNISAMQQAYAKLALDKNYRILTPCPYLPNAYLNTAHGTRGLTTAPICSASLVAEMLGLPQPLSPTLRQALHPNRTVIRAIIRQQPLLATE
ncbi:FAD-dependent 5-carboxymethylaminomethyl-2-thiouridine(34) oxidoreductase MnmC [Neisseria animalis]|uniref:FAD-dependent oxidoreductase n=1 Tax=Neisseria animalis TaxID=492 RepID=A0A5P3MUX2_NEIAN|nr:FAD-dependent 5-carboxymethylaminomethyl-2-thiouridine(34) oxidoreductase MnmC [Neisseria animalis]QEY24459.1 FAD-dependent oxidoreductase [Neisseria animalis]QEY24461.1 FAD-dependent oxidoreductase [Neisseria animalis]ROW33119.1 FAD-dependent oxidoreductase [Neisseria animalis]VEE07110.1 putative oxidoreductase [Neisseria animalis]VEE07116.1 putative oxidoreductase [Neisseria animalis]